LRSCSILYAFFSFLFFFNYLSSSAFSCAAAFSARSALWKLSQVVRNLSYSASNFGRNKANSL
jgi:hypothetical protein